MPEPLERRVLMCALTAHDDDGSPVLASSSTLSSPPSRPDVAVPHGARAVTRASRAAIPQLSSLPGAPANLYLDFDGDDASWQFSAYSLDADRSRFSSVERASIRRTIERVADTYAPFNLNVTTVAPDPDDDVAFKTLHVVIGSDGNPWAGGFSDIGSFRFGDHRSYAYDANSDALAFVITHEAGHGFGLFHQGAYDPGTGQLLQEYRTHDGDVPGVIMGAAGGIQRNVWGNREWAGGGAGSVQDDMAIIAGPDNGFGYRPDDHGDTPAAATPLAVAGGRATAAGVIHHHTEQDWFRFEWAGGPLALALDGPKYGQMLNAHLELRDAAGNLVAADGDDYPRASIVRSNLPSGSYRVGVKPGSRVETPGGAGTARVRTSYGEVGSYTLRLQAGTDLQAPFHGTPLRIHSDTPVMLEVEDYDLGGAGVARSFADGHESSATRGYDSGPRGEFPLEWTPQEGHFLHPGSIHDGAWMEYTVDVAHAGTYALAARTASQASGGAIRLSVDGVERATMSLPNTGDMSGWQTTTSGSIDLPAGRHVLRVTVDGAAPGDAWSMNWVRLTHAGIAAQTPFPAGTTREVSFAQQTVIQVEDYDRGGQGVAYNDATPTQNTGGAYRATEGVDLKTTTDAGGGVRLSDAAPGEWLEYSVDVIDGGWYDLEFRAGSIAAGGAFHAAIDGVDVTGQLAVPETGSYDVMRRVRAPRVELEPGRHVIRLAFDAQAGTTGAAGAFNWILLRRGDLPRVSVVALDAVADEAGPVPGVIGFTRTNDPLFPEEPVAIQLARGGTASGDDYRVDFSDVVTIAHDMNEVSHGIHPAQDGLVEGDETLTFRILPQPGYVIEDADTATFTIRDDPNAVPPAVSIRAAADAYVRDGSHAGTNFGAATQLQVKKGAAGWNRETFLRFSLSGVSSVGTAKLRLFGRLDNTSSASVAFSVYSSTNTTWGESGLTWNTRPSASTTALVSGTVTGTTGKWYELDLTSYVKGRKAAGATAVTLVLRTAVTSGSTIVFDSDETATTSNRPALVVTQGTVTPPPSTPTALRAAADTYVRDGSHSTTNFGGSTQLQLKQGATGWNRESYLRFDLSGVSTVNSAKLRLFGRLDNTSAATVGFNVTSTVNTSWNESTLVWDGRPPGIGLHGTGTVTGTTAKWYEVDLTTFLKQLKDDGKTAVTLVLKASSASGSTIVFDSDEAASNRPELVLG